MKLFTFPYRWLPRTFWENITHPFWDIRNGLRNLPVFFEAVWWFRSWDWTGMIKLLEICAREMRKDQEMGIHVGDRKEARRLLIVEALCKRMLDDDYFENAGHRRETWLGLPDHERTRIASHSEYMAKQDVDHLVRILKFVRNWWA